jgi:hypothetical protein
MRQFTLAMLCCVFAVGTADAEPPMKLTLQTEGVNFPAGTVCRAEIRAEYRIVQPRISANDAGRQVEVTDDMATFVAPAPERQAWRFVAAPKTNGRQSFEFTLPADLPRAHGSARAAIYVPVTYSIAVAGFPEVKQQQTFVVRVDATAPGKPVSRCLRFELINGSQLRTGLLPTCNDSFETRGAQPLAASD